MAGTSFSKHNKLGPHLTHQHPTESVGYQLPIFIDFLKLMLALKGDMRGSLGGSVVWRLPLAQGVILETQD